MKKLLIVMVYALTSCSSKPITHLDWEQCWEACIIEDEYSMLIESCHSISKGLGCTCSTGTTHWLNE